ncbi:M1 family metallopeptidase [Modestobacter lapidis]|nr:M1 family metallopeptidase [Modestobacter lapidis]
MYRRLATVGLTTAVTLGLLAGPAAATHDPTPGAPGIGDPYYPLAGNGGYDVGSYDLALTYDPATDLLRATATIEARATQFLSSFNLDLEGLDVESVTVDDRDAAWGRVGGELTVTPQGPLPAGRHFTTAVTYSGIPQQLASPLGSTGFTHTDDGALVAGQPDSAASWFPSNDHPLDAASFDVRITVPEGLEAVSNGVLEGRRTAAGWTTWHWRAPAPMATYLVVLAIGEFDLRAYEVAGVQYWDALDPDLFTPLPELPDLPPLGVTAEASLARQPEVLAFLAELFGPYPFRAAGGIVDDPAELSFALETQTRPVYASGFFADPIGGDLVVVHELAHQWTGNLVRLAAWEHFWLNEGFATYAEWLWLEREGLVPVQQQFDTLMSDLLPADDPFWTVLPGDPGPDALFSAAVYIRGALTLHALRQAVGDDDFFRTLRTWTSAQAGEAVTTADFVALAEQESGRDLDTLFRAWLYTAEKPAAG